VTGTVASGHQRRFPPANQMVISLLGDPVSSQPDPADTQLVWVVIITLAIAAGCGVIGRICINSTAGAIAALIGGVITLLDITRPPNPPHT